MPASGSRRRVNSVYRKLKMEKWGFPIEESGYNYQRKGERILDGKKQQIDTSLHTEKQLIVKYSKVRGNSVGRTLLNGSTKLVPRLSESTSR